MSGSGPVTRVLLVDDEPTMRSLIRLMLHRSGRYTVVGEAGDGQQAIEVATSQQPDVVLLDLSMPRMDGLEALPKLRAKAPEAIVIVLSGFTNGGAATTAREAGAAGYLEKGLNPAELLAALDGFTGADGTAPAQPAS